MKQVLIANRGEIAVRIARACVDYGVKSVAVYADPDINALHTRLASEAWGLEGSSPAATYLNIEKLLQVARKSGADAIHPGYGFLSENASFAEAVIAAGLKWIGPPPAAIAALGNKVSARKIALEAGAPLVAGTAGPVTNAAEVKAFAETNGLPIAIKAAFGGGGRGLKVVWHMDEIEDLYASAVREAETAFGRGECFVEQFLDKPRHVEAQVIADVHGNVVVLGTRDCSLQRRNQKLVEEAPAPFLTDVQRQSIHKAARDVCAHAGYVSAGTVEFLLSKTGAISFLEVNTRLQVEHPVTEETAGIDLVVEQLRIADGLPLSILETPEPKLHAFEFRINAEDVGRGFLPSPGHIEIFEPPGGPGVRVDSGVVSGSDVPGLYDSLMSKLIVTGRTRDEAIVRARRALAEFRIEGVPSVLPFHRAVLEHPDFTGPQFNVHTRWIETDFINELPAAVRSVPVRDKKLLRTTIELDGRLVQLGLPDAFFSGMKPSGGAEPHSASAAQENADSAEVPAPITGTVAAWKVADGDIVEANQLVAVMEAMKMETQILAHRTGRIALKVDVGVLVSVGSGIARITA